MKDRILFNIRTFLLLAALSLCLTGCSTAGTDELTDLDTVQTDQEKENQTDSGQDSSVSEKAEEQKKESSKTDAEGEDTKILIHVCGAVHAPGVYTLDCGARVFEAVSAAGGVMEDGCGEALNQARVLVDGERIYVPTFEEVEQGVVVGEEPRVTGTENEGKINLNTATKEELMTLPGIGESKADCILSYREEHGKFNSIEELMNIEGIKEGVFNKIKDKIVVTV